MPEPAALIAGGTSGIGRATARLLHRRGYRVMVTGENPAAIAEARRELPDDVVVARVDACSPTDTDRVAEEVRSRFGELTALFLNAGIVRSVPLSSVDELSCDEVFDANAKGQFFTLRKTLPMLADGASVIVTVGAGATHGIAGGALVADGRGRCWRWCPPSPSNWPRGASAPTR